jgi:hypothetical protein
MRLSGRMLASIAVIAFLAFAVVWLFRGPLGIKYHLWRLHQAELRIFASGPSNPLDVVVGFLVGRRTSADWSAVRDRHEEALIRMGYFARREFPFTNQHVTAGQLVRIARDGFGTQFSSVVVITNGQRLSGTTVASSSFARIVAPVEEMKDWDALITDLDGRAR